MSARRAIPHAPDSFIVRVYRRGANPSEPVAGTVERADGGAAARFASAEELWTYLTASASGRPRRTTPRS